MVDGVNAEGVEGLGFDDEAVGFKELWAWVAV
jgi:hypothetical protein